ncbi:hypothetical protein [Haloechinothrix halophila]|uniref:hypothetical protein n=1 Tax=Haloechinothrix halophila TaxID=1069073 RepID=UPI0005564146|nr:hypothetical protein [Haloechinothrix halophila]
MAWYRVLTAIPVQSDDHGALKTLRTEVRWLLAAEATPTVSVDGVQLAEDGWLEVQWRIAMNSDERSGVWALRTLRAALAAACHALRRGGRGLWVEVGDGFAVSVEPHVQA